MVLVAASPEALGDKAARRPDTMTAEIPVWVNNRQRWVTGVGRKTTCDDVITVLLKSEGARGSGDDVCNPGTSCNAGGGGGGSSPTEGHGYAIMERWRRVERPLDGRARILKVWNAWGDEQSEVRLTLRRVDYSEADSGRGSPPTATRESHGGTGQATSSSHRRRRHRHHRSHRTHHRDHHGGGGSGGGSGKPPWAEAVHPRRLAQLHHHSELNGHKLPETIERLMKLILAQGETIQSQLRKLQERENLIEHLEEETHRARVQELGSNYLLETYLGTQLDAAGSAGAVGDADEEEKGDDSGVVTEGGSDQASPGGSSSAPEDDTTTRPRAAPPRRPVLDDDEDNFADESDEGAREHSAADDAALLDLKTQVDLWEKVVKVNKRLEREEETLVRLHIKFRRLQSEGVAVCEDEGGGGAATLTVLPEDDAESLAARDALLAELDRVGAQLEAGARDSDEATRALAEADAQLEARRHYLRRLQAELDASDRETDLLQREIAVAETPTSQHGITTAIVHAPPPPPTLTKHSNVANKPKTHGPIHDTDSNSDTGLSSLHSGSEEGVYILDTLV